MRDDDGSLSDATKSIKLVYAEVVSVMTHDEVDAITILNFQQEVLSDFDDHLRARRGDALWETDSDEIDARERELEHAALEWCRENDVNPEHLENSLARYSTNFSLAAGGKPLHITRARDSADTHD